MIETVARYVLDEVQYVGLHFPILHKVYYDAQKREHIRRCPAIHADVDLPKV